MWVLSRSDGAQMFIARWPTDTHFPPHGSLLLNREPTSKIRGTCDPPSELDVKYLVTIEEEKSWFGNARTGRVAGDAGEQVERGGEGDADGDSEGELLLFLRRVFFASCEMLQM